MSQEPIDLASFEYDGVVYSAPADDAISPPWRLIKAIANGEVTRGGLAEAGWHEVGTIAENGLEFGNPLRDPGLT